MLEVGPAHLPVLPSGRVHEIVRLDAAPALTHGLTIRPIGEFERTWRMAWRVFNQWKRLSAWQRRACGLTLWRMLGDLPGAYGVATRFRGLDYRAWCEAVDVLTDDDEQRIRARIGLWKDGPRFLLRRQADGQGDWAATEVSVAAQWYPHCAWWSQGAPIEDGDWMILLAPGDRLRPHALYWVADEVRRRPDALAIYWDDDRMDSSGRRGDPRFKPDWSRLHLEATNYIGRAVAVNAARLAAKGLWPENEASLRLALLLLTAQEAAPVVHIPAVLSHRPPDDLPPETFRVPVVVPHPVPRVIILIPTRDGLPLLKRCVESVRAKTDYPRYEIIVIDNGSREAETLAWLEREAASGRIRRLVWDRSFNYSVLNNFAARQVEGEILCLLNNDTEVITPDWLTEMVGHLCRDRVGLVGAKLYYPDGRIQHAGDTVGPGGCANHLHQFWPGDSPGYCNRAIVAQEVSAVTAACLVTWRDLYLRLGGLNERWLPVAFNDVDYCLRVRKAGYKVVFTPHAELYHHESVSRGKDRGWRKEWRAWREVRYMRWKWRREMRNDPFYNPNFSYFRADFALGPAPNVRRPWR